MGNLARVDQRIGAAFQARGSQIDWPKLNALLGHVCEVFEAAQRGVSRAETAGLLSSDQKILEMRALQQSTVPIIKELNLFWIHSVGLSPHRATGLDAHEHGLRIRTHFDRCSESLKAAKESVPDGVTIRLAKHCLAQILLEFRRLQILDQCLHCHRVMFPTTSTKRCCSIACEGRDCSHAYQSQRSYKKAREQMNPKSQSEAARIAANIRWQKHKREYLLFPPDLSGHIERRRGECQLRTVVACFKDTRNCAHSLTSL